MWLGYSFMGPEIVSLSYWSDLATLMLQPLWQLNSHPQHSLEIQMSLDLNRQSVLIKRNTFNFHPLFFSQSKQWEMVLIDIWREKKQFHVWRKAVILKDEPATTKWKGKSPPLLSPCLHGPKGSLSSPFGMQQLPDDILNIIALCALVCLFCVYIWNIQGELCRLNYSLLLKWEDSHWSYLLACIGF